MGELTVREETAPAVAQDAPPNMSQLAQWARDADEAYRIAGMLAKTSFVPESIRNQEDLTAAILTGQELGLPPMAALRGMDVIYGVPALRAHLMRGLVQSRGHEVELVESSDRRCVMRGRRKGSEKWQQVEWTIERATKLLGQLKNQWTKQPTTMLIARATGEICRLIAADVLYAAPYAAEELDDQGRPSPSVSAAPVTAAEILGDGGQDDDPGNGADFFACEHKTTDEPGHDPNVCPRISEAQWQALRDGSVDPDAEAAAQLAEETGGWPPVRKPGSGA
ncbi:hypothetical protein ACIBI3_02180 [Actinomadura luteofluorescens]|uniref:hypothetical protein n=1 Tax=Actinomadura luteofluorescens TaxID=46163 RepID=UPI00347F1299